MHSITDHPKPAELNRDSITQLVKRVYDALDVGDEAMPRGKLQCTDQGGRLVQRPSWIISEAMRSKPAGWPT